MFWGPTNTAGKIEFAFLLVTGVAVLFLAAVTFFMILFLIKYNRRRHPRAEDVAESLGLEILWTVIPLALTLALFYFGWKDFDTIRNAPSQAMPVKVIARQWSWLFAYENGRESDVLRVPVGRPVRLLLTSQDVIHCLYIPAFRIKEDCVPGMTTHLWFTVTEPGTYDIFCTEYCGVGHAHMRSQVIGVSAAEFDGWLQGGGAPGGPTSGFKLLSDKGCLGCHTLDGSPKIGPTFKGLYGSKVRVVDQGHKKEISADADYLRGMILHPGLIEVEGYPSVMPKIPLTAEELEAIVEALKGYR